VSASERRAAERARLHDMMTVSGVVMDVSPCSPEPLMYRRHEVVSSLA
jgi:hypothetical protein